MGYPKQKKGKAIIADQINFRRTARKTKKCNINPKVMRGGIRL